MVIKKELAYFQVKLIDNQYAFKTKSKLEKMAADMKIEIFDLRPNVIFVYGETSQKTYESAFRAKLAYKTRYVLSGGKRRKIGEWHETKKAQVPESLEDLISEIKLVGKKIPCKR